MHSWCLPHGIGCGPKPYTPKELCPHSYAPIWLQCFTVWMLVQTTVDKAPNLNFSRLERRYKHLSTLHQITDPTELFTNMHTKQGCWCTHPRPLFFPSNVEGTWEECTLSTQCSVQPDQLLTVKTVLSYEETSPVRQPTLPVDHSRFLLQLNLKSQVWKRTQHNSLWLLVGQYFHLMRFRYSHFDMWTATICPR